MVPAINPDAKLPAHGRMYRALLWLETRCSIRGVSEVSLGDVAAFFREIGEPDLAESFKEEYLYSADTLRPPAGCDR